MSKNTDNKWCVLHSWRYDGEYCPKCLEAEEVKIRQRQVADEMHPGPMAQDFIGTANKTQIGGSHYKRMRIQPWDFIAENNIGFFEGNIISYVCRWHSKNGLEDLQKAKHYIDKLIELHLQAPRELK